MSRFLIVFVKNPAPGSVKTRLHQGYSPAEAAELYRAFVRDCLEGCLSVDADRRVICHDPPTAASETERLVGPGWEVRPQAPGDLGARMTEAFEWSFGEGAESAVVLGSDAPTLPATHVDQAFNLLVRSEIVLGPSTDGGYYLIGLSGPHPEVFAGIDWGTDSVFARTLERTAGLTLDLVPLWYDVDTPEDLDLLVTHGTALERSEHAQAALHTRRCHADIHERRSAQADG